MLERYPGLFLAAALAGGVALRESAAPWVSFGLGSAAAAAITVSVLMPLGRRSARLPARRATARRWALRLAGFALLGILRGTPPAAAGASLPLAPPRLVEVEGIVDEPPVEVRSGEDPRRPLETRLALRLPGGRADVAVRCNGRLPGIAGGDRLRAAGLLLAPRGARNPGDRRLAASPLLIVSHPGAIARLPAAGPWSPVRLLGRSREGLLRVLERLYGERTRGFLLAFLLGDRRLLAPDVRDAFELTGTFHMLAISGVHLAILMFYFLRLPLPPRARFPCRLAFLAGFSVLTGSSPPVLRAALMLSLQLLLQEHARAPCHLNTLGWSALILVAWDPSLLHDAGFQLSIAGVFFLLTWGARLTAAWTARNRSPFAPPAPSAPGKKARRRRRIVVLAAGAREARRGFLRALAISVAAAAGTAPLVHLHFFRFHPLSPLWNLAAGPLLGLALVGGFASLLLGLIHPWLGAPVAAGVGWLCEAVMALLDAGAALPGSAVHLPPPAPLAAAGAYALLVLGLGGSGRRLLLGAGGAALLLAAGASGCRGRPPEVWHFDARAGDAALVSGPAGSFLIDAGMPGERLGAGKALARAVLAAGRRAIGGVFLTHPHADHVRSLEVLQARLAVGGVWVSSFFARSAYGARVSRALGDTGTPISTIERGACFAARDDGGFRVDVLHPGPPESLAWAANANDTSLALRVSWRGEAVLFLGDLEEEGLMRLLAAAAPAPEAAGLRAQVLLFPHHGRANRLWRELVDAVAPRAVVFSGSGRGGGEETARRIEALGIETFATWRRGAVRTVWREGKGWTPAYWRDGE